MSRYGPGVERLWFYAPHSLVKRIRALIPVFGSLSAVLKMVIFVGLPVVERKQAEALKRLSEQG
jgi:hypothetical protein